ncbi:UNVERIFIED_CONTAM: hypothetical protein ACS92_05205 [Bacillus cereus]
MLKKSICNFAGAWMQYFYFHMTRLSNVALQRPMAQADAAQEQGLGRRRRAGRGQRGGHCARRLGQFSCESQELLKSDPQRGV